MRRTGGGSEERVGGDFASHRAREIALRARRSLVTPGNKRLKSLDRDQPPTANLDGAELACAHQLVDSGSGETVGGDRLVDQVGAALVGVRRGDPMQPTDSWQE